MWLQVGVTKYTKALNNRGSKFRYITTINVDLRRVTVDIFTWCSRQGYYNHFKADIFENKEDMFYVIQGGTYMVKSNIYFV